ncbi:TetR/AcrR family transcriptional regulator [Actinomadura craniellae]|uniref:TetR/AcrR family transcriptional regulator n=2 Tax=Actinomadura craniellae TaxID=2231787 RepID=A0A365H9R3_9ACTN|nr:TetR/AcrR family transcriptional regulator [Actinomadura craniellae]
MSRPERERQMLDVAEQVFAERGYRAASMDEIAERCGVSKPMLYEYFGSKDGLLLACVARVRTELYDATAAAMSGVTEPEEILRRGMSAYFAFMDTRSRSFAMLIQEPMALPSATSEAIEAARRQQSGLIAPVLAAFAPDVPAHAVEAYAEIIIGACERLAIWRTHHPEVTAEEAARYMSDFSWHGLKVHVPGHG